MKSDEREETVVLLLPANEEEQRQEQQYQSLEKNIFLLIRYIISMFIFVLLCLGILSLSSVENHNNNGVVVASSDIITTQTNSINPFVPCPFHDMDIFLVALERDFPMINHLMRSMDAFLPCYNLFHIFLPSYEEIENLKVWIDTTHPQLRLHVMEAPDSLKFMDGYIIQAWLMMWSDLYSNATYFFYMDTDVILTVPVTYNSVFSDGHRLKLPYWSFVRQNQFQTTCVELMGSCMGSFMSYLPIVLPRTMFLPMRNHIAKQIHTLYGGYQEEGVDDLDFNAAFTYWTHHTQNYKAFSQFATMGNYLALYEPQTVDVIFFPSDDELSKSPLVQKPDYIPLGYHYGCCYWTRVDLNVDTFPEFSRKYTLGAIKMMYQVFHMSLCLQSYIQQPTLGLPFGCTEKDITTIHSEVNPYPNLPINWQYIYKTYNQSAPYEKTYGYYGDMYDDNEY